MKKILLLFFHPERRRSKINRTLFEHAHGIEGVTLHDVYEAYPRFHINVEFEKNLLLNAEIILFQHPFYWYSCPPLMKLWLDEVLELGFAYGPNGTKLSGKYWAQAISTAGQAQAYHRSGRNHFTMDELLRPFEQTALLCQMIPIKPFIIHGSYQRTQEEVLEQAKKYRDWIQSLAQGGFEGRLHNTCHSAESQSL